MAQVNRPATIAGIKALVPRRQSDECAGIPLTLLTLLVAGTPFAGVVEAKGYGPIPRRNDIPSPNLLLTLLPLTAAPFKPVVEAKGYGPIPRRNELPPQNLTLTLLPTTQKPFVPVVEAKGYGPIPRRNELPPQNLSLTLQPLTQKPFTPYEWPVIPRPAPRVAEAVENLLLATLSAAPALAPFSPEMEDWDAPRWTPIRRIEESVNLLLTLLPTTLAPFSPEMEDWDAPRLPPARQVDALAPNLLLSTLASPALAPFSPEMEDWDAPRWMPIRRIEESPNLLLTLLPTTQVPFSPEMEDWDAPRWMPLRQSEISSNLLLTLLGSTATQPFENMEWSRPIVTPLRQAQPDPLNLSLYLRPAPFVAQEWMTMPVRRATRASESYTNYVLKTLPQPAPFLNYDWVANAKTRTRYAPYQEPNLLMTVLFGLNPVGEPYKEPSATERPYQFDSKVRTMKFPAKDRRFSLE